MAITSAELVNLSGPNAGLTPAAVAAAAPASTSAAVPSTAAAALLLPEAAASGNKSSTGGASSNSAGGGGIGMCDEKTVEYLRDLIAEKQTIESNNNNGSSPAATKSIVLKLLDQEIARIQSGGKPPGRDSKFVDIYHEKPVRLTVRALVPVKEHPKFNFVGKLLGPKGNSMKRLQEETMTKMAVLGRGSMRNKQQEEDLRNSSDPKYQHLSEDLHVEITAFAPPSEAHARIAYALTEVRKYMIPDSNDEIRQEQMREMELLNNNNTNGDPGSNEEGVSGDESGNDNGSSPSSMTVAPPAASSSPSPPSSSVIAMRGLATQRVVTCSTTAQTPCTRTTLNTSNGFHQQRSSQQTNHVHVQPGNQRKSASGGSNVKYLRTTLNSHVVPNNTPRVTSPSRANTSKVRVYSILDKIRAAQDDRFRSTGSQQQQQTNPVQHQHESFLDSINIVEDNGFTFEDYEPSSEVSTGVKGYKTSPIDRGRYRMHLAPYSRPK